MQQLAVWSLWLGNNLWSRDVRGWLGTHGTRVVVILVVMAVARRLASHLLPPSIRRGVHHSAGDVDAAEVLKRVDTLSRVSVWLATLAVLVIGIFMILGEVGYNLAPVIAGLGIGGIAIGLGAQSLVKDTINGLFILGENQFARGDFVTIAGVSGTVQQVNLRRTLLRDVNGTLHSIPNSAVQVSSNHTRDYSGLSVRVLIGRGADLERALTVATQAGEEIAQDPRFAGDVLEAPRPERIEAIDEKGVTVRIIGRVRAGQQVGLTFAYERRLEAALIAAGVSHDTTAPADADAAKP